VKVQPERQLGRHLKAFIVGLIGNCAVACCATQTSAQDAVGVRTVELAETFKVLRLGGNGGRWHRPADGAPLVISFRIATEAQEFPGARNCRKITAPDELIAASDVSNASFRQELAAAFLMWESIVDLSFREAAEGERADILVGAQVEPEGRAFADVFYDDASTERVKPISQALICLNPARRWKVGFDGDLTTWDLRYTLAHEIGHTIGLDHPNGAGQIMGQSYEEGFRTLQPGDVKGAATLYGVRPQNGVVIASETEVQPSAVEPGPPTLEIGAQQFFQ